jgi:hypothetical protein
LEQNRNWYWVQVDNKQHNKDSPTMTSSSNENLSKTLDDDEEELDEEEVGHEV